jgi:hypothetical protein
LLLGDLQYDRGELTEFQLNFDRDWGTLRDISHAVPGNHEYATPKAEGYFTYWSGDKASSNQAGERGKGYYSFDIGSWHFIALNSNCEHIGGCGEDLDQSKWLKNDITVASNKCTIAFWHHPVFTVGRYSENRQQTIKGETFWRLLDGNAAIILNGHDHNYQRFEPQNLQGLPSPQSPRQFVVGTGGKTLYQLKLRPKMGFASDNTFGFLELQLSEGSYKWWFRDVQSRVIDNGVARCPGN